MTGAVSLHEAKSYLQTLNLTYIIEAMCAASYPLPRWAREDAERCCQLYKNFLYLQKKHFPQPLVPTREIDEFWHNHILYTKQYTHDCEHIFGHYLHHVPASPSEDMQALVDDFLQTKQWYLEEFGEPLIIVG
jgi:hypothetical protein